MEAQKLDEACRLHVAECVVPRAEREDTLSRALPCLDGSWHLFWVGCYGRVCALQSFAEGLGFHASCFSLISREDKTEDPKKKV